MYIYILHLKATHALLDRVQYQFQPFIDLTIATTCDEIQDMIDIEWDNVMFTYGISLNDLLIEEITDNDDFEDGSMIDTDQEN